MRPSLSPHRIMRRRSGFTLAEVLLAGTLMAMIAYATSTIYFSTLNIYNETIWRLPPYDEATYAVNRMTDEMREAMLIESFGPSYIVAVLPQKGMSGDYTLTLGPSGYSLSLGDRVALYMSDATGALDTEGNCLWLGIQPQGETSFSRTRKLAENIHPELNPVDPATGLARPMFTYWPDEVRLWGVEMWVTSTALVHGQSMTQTAHSEVFLRNL